MSNIRAPIQDGYIAFHDFKLSRISTLARNRQKSPSRSCYLIAVTKGATMPLKPVE